MKTKEEILKTEIRKHENWKQFNSSISELYSENTPILKAMQEYSDLNNAKLIQENEEWKNKYMLAFNKVAELGCENAILKAEMEMYREKYTCNQCTVVNQQETITELKAYHDANLHNFNLIAKECESLQSQLSKANSRIAELKNGIKGIIECCDRGNTMVNSSISRKRIDNLKQLINPTK